MATWNDQTKDTTQFVNQALGPQSKTWNQAIETWDQASTETWDKPILYSNPTKSTTPFTNQTKN